MGLDRGGGVAGAASGVAGRPFRQRLSIAAIIVVLLGAIVPRPITVTGPFVAAPARLIPLTSPDSGVVGAGLRAARDLGDTGNAAGRDPGFRSRAKRRSPRGAGPTRSTARETQARAAGRPAEVARLEAERATEDARLAGLEADRDNLTIRAVGSGMVLTPRPEDLAGRWVDRGSAGAPARSPDSVEVRVALTGSGSTLVRPGQPSGSSSTPTGLVSPPRSPAWQRASAGDSGAVEVRVALPVGPDARAGMTGEASVTLRQSNVWGSLWWGVRRRIRSDILL